MAFLFDTDALSEALRKRPAPGYVTWLRKVPRDEQFTSAICIGELFQGAFEAGKPELVAAIEHRVLAEVIVLPFDVGVARLYGSLRAELRRAGAHPGDADVQIAATALHHGLELVTGNIRHHERIPGLVINRVFADLRGQPLRKA